MAKDEKSIHRRYAELQKKLNNDQLNVIYDCYMQGVNYDGHTWVTWTDVERLLLDLDEVGNE